jgi:hypothetical protein
MYQCQFFIQLNYSLQVFYKYNTHVRAGKTVVCEARKSEKARGNCVIIICEMDNKQVNECIIYVITRKETRRGDND